MKCSIVIGGSRGLGKALVDVFSRGGWTVHEFSRTGNPPYNRPLDLTQPSESLKVFSGFLSTIHHDQIDKMVMILNSAVILPIRKAAHLTPEEMHGSLNVNVVGSLFICQAYLRQFRHLACPKYLVNIGSGAAHRGFPGWSLYCAGKAATESFIRAVYEEEKTEPHPFHVFNYDPHVMDTRMQEEIRSSAESDFPLVERFRAFHAEGQLAPPERVAHHLYDLIDAREGFHFRHEFGS